MNALSIWGHIMVACAIFWVGVLYSTHHEDTRNNGTVPVFGIGVLVLMFVSIVVFVTLAFVGVNVEKP